MEKIIFILFVTIGLTHLAYADLPDACNAMGGTYCVKFTAGKSFPKNAGPTTTLFNFRSHLDTKTKKIVIIRDKVAFYRDYSFADVVPSNLVPSLDMTDYTAQLRKNGKPLCGVENIKEATLMNPKRIEFTLRYNRRTHSITCKPVN